MWGEKYEKIFKDFEELKNKCNKIIYFDTTDSTGALQVELLDIIDSYWKMQIYNDKKLYLKEFFGSRIFTDHLKTNSEFQNLEGNFSNKITNIHHLKKIKIGWNSCFSNYSLNGNFYNKLFFKTGYKKFMFFNNSFNQSHKTRSIDISARFNKNYSRKTIEWQRKNIAIILKNKIFTNKVSKRKYYNELSRSKLSISPFGWGEITYRDFESINEGSVILKPDMDHLETWPNFYIKNFTYIPFKWNLSNLIEIVEDTLNHYNDFKELAYNSQKIYIDHTIKKKSHEIFFNRLIKLLNET